MKYLAILLGCSFAFGATHNVVLKLDRARDLNTIFTEYTDMTWKQLGSSSVYKVKINSSLSRAELMDSLFDNTYVVAAEENQRSSVGTLEAASKLDSRVIFFVDNIDSNAVYDETTLNSRVIFFVDSRQTQYDAVFKQYHMTEVNADLAWPHTSGRGQTVAVLDTGVDVDHPFLVNNLVNGYDFVDDDSVPDDIRSYIDTSENGIEDEGYGHGTHVAGIVATIAPGASIMPIRVADSDGQADLFNLIQGLEYAIQHGADVINLSMSIAEPSELLMEAVNKARTAGIVVVTSAGNNNNTQLMFPATESEVITVTSLDPNRRKSSFANYGNGVDVAAPGEMIISAMPGGGFVARSGTSMAAPIVSAQVAMIFELVPNNSVQYVHHRVVNKVQDISRENPGFNNKLGKGLADVWDSITLQSQQ